MPITGKEFGQRGLIDKVLHNGSIAGGDVNLVNFVKVFDKDLLHVQVGQLEVKVIALGQHAQVKESDGEIAGREELMHVEFLHQPPVIVADLVVQG